MCSSLCSSWHAQRPRSFRLTRMKSGRAPASLCDVNSVRMVQVGLGPHGRNWARQVLPNVREIDVVAYVDTDPYALDSLQAGVGEPADPRITSLHEATAPS